MYQAWRCTCCSTWRKARFYWTISWWNSWSSEQGQCTSSVLSIKSQKNALKISEVTIQNFCNRIFLNSFYYFFVLFTFDAFHYCEMYHLIIFKTIYLFVPSNFRKKNIFFTKRHENTSKNDFILANPYPTEWQSFKKQRWKIIYDMNLKFHS